MSLALASIWLVLLFGCYIGYQLLKQNGRILVQLEKLEHRLNAVSTPPIGGQTVPVGLPLHSSAPEFSLPQLSGSSKSLSDFKGHRLVLIFFDPQCGFCQQMVPQLAELRSDDLMPLIVSTGDAQQNRELFNKNGIRWTVLLQQQMEIASKYLIGGTPMGYVIDEQGRIASGLAAGANALLALFFEREPGKPEAAAQTENGHKAFRGNRTLADSRISRDGLKAGTEAPNFTLPLLSGGEFSLAAYRGRPLMLVFSAADCGPCNTLAPKLEQQHRLHPEIQVVMISRGDKQALDAKAREYNLTFPIAVQRHWEISRLYGIFATPVAYYIDQNGIIAGDVAIGENPILQLFSVAKLQAV